MKLGERLLDDVERRANIIGEIDRAQKIAEQMYLKEMGRFNLGKSFTESEILETNQIAINCLILANNFVGFENHSRENMMKQYGIEPEKFVMRLDGK